MERVRPPFDIPSTFAAQGARGGAFVDFLDRLPRLVAELLDEWQLSLDGEPTHGACALVVPVHGRDGVPAVLKIGFPHDEGRNEHLALRHWQGNGTVRLLRADPRRWALLLERLHADRDLTSVWDIEACEVVAGLYPRLHVEPPARLRRLSSYVDTWTDGLAALRPDAPVPRRLVEQAVALGRAFVTDGATDTRMIHGDLHYENVLAGDREPWLVIDPKPVAGDPHYEVAPLLWNRWDEVVASGDVRDAVRRRFHTVVDAAQLDEHRARDWVVVRELHNVLWTLEDAVRDQRALTDEDQAWVTASVAIAKAVQD
jgi:streptomycin 6-kinase